MNKMKLLSVFLMCLAICSIAMAKFRVINVDINGYNDNNYYEGTAAYTGPDGDYWVPYFGGWGVPVGAKDSANLAQVGSRSVNPNDFNDPNWASVYTAQVWLGDPGPGQAAHHYFRWSSPSNPGLMNDGFIEDVNNPRDPNIKIFGFEAYTGRFDIYVYGTEDSNFTMTWRAVNRNITEFKPITGGFTGTFVEGQNYVIFRDVNVVAGYPVNLTYSKTLNALQLVKKKPAASIRVPALGADPNVFILASPWDEASEYNNRANENNYFGPSEWAYNDGNFPGLSHLRLIGFIDHWEYAMYDIDVQEAGLYEISPLLFVRAQNCDSLGILVNSKHAGRTGDVPLVPARTSPPYDNSLREPLAANRVKVNLFQGENTVGWIINRLHGSVQTGYAIAGLYIRPAGDVEMPDCNAVTTYGYNYDADLNKDCVVNQSDLGLFTGQWLNSNNP